MTPFVIFLIVILGLEVGSFANVCIFRWPLDSSIMSPRRSQCVSCKRQIAWFDNIPVISYLLLKGQCRHCQEHISARYPIVELLVPALWLSVLLPFQNVLSGHPVFIGLLFYTLFVLVVTTFTDLDWKIIPDEATYSLAAVGLLLSPWNLCFFSEEPLGRLIQSLLGCLAGGGILFLVAVAGRFFFKKEAMGGGDIKLLAALGTVLGYEGVVVILTVGSIVGGLYAAPLLLIGRLKRQSYLPFGPFLNIGALTALFLLLKKIS